MARLELIKEKTICCPLLKKQRKIKRQKWRVTNVKANMLLEQLGCRKWKRITKFHQFLKIIIVSKVMCMCGLQEGVHDQPLLGGLRFFRNGCWRGFSIFFWTSWTSRSFSLLFPRWTFCSWVTTCCLGDKKAKVTITSFHKEASGFCGGWGHLWPCPQYQPWLSALF